MNRAAGRFVAFEAQALGRGGVSLMALISGLARSTIYHAPSDIRGTETDLVSEPPAAGCRNGLAVAQYLRSGHPNARRKDDHARGIWSLLLCQLAGEALVKVSGLPMPGPVVGMVLLVGLLLVGLLAVRAPLLDGLRSTAEALIGNLSLLFVPADVGVVPNLKIFGSEGIRLVVVLIVSTAITLVVTAAVFAGLVRLVYWDRAAAKLTRPIRKNHEKLR